MSNPVIVNRAPNHDSVAGVMDTVRFGVRDTTQEVDRLTLGAKIGFSTAFYQPTAIPQKYVETPMSFVPLFGTPVSNILVNIVGDELRLWKNSPGVNQRGIFYFGGLQSPAAVDDPLMLEAVVRVDDSGPYPYLPSGGLLGAMFGLKTETKGVKVMLGDGTVEIHSSDAFPDVAIYSAAHDILQETLYKLYWDPLNDVLKLYISTDPSGAAGDTLLIDGAVSSIPLALEEPPVDSPVAFFGHGYTNPQSVTFWKSVALHNRVYSPLNNGLLSGNLEGFVLTDSAVEMNTSELPTKSDQTWSEVPPSFSPIGGNLSREDGSVVIDKISGSSFGIYREEPEVATGNTAIDFAVKGELLVKDDSSASSGMELYIDDGSSAAVFSLLDSSNKQYVALMKAGDPKDVGSYAQFQTSWGVFRNYRLVNYPSSGCKIVEYVASSLGGVEEKVLTSLTSAEMVSSFLPGPGLGVLHDSYSADSLARFFIDALRYSKNMQEISPGFLPTSPWELEPVAPLSSPSVVDGFIVMDDQSLSDKLAYYKPEPTFGSDNGFVFEFRAKVNSFINGTLTEGYMSTGVGVEVDDGNARLRLVFVHSGSSRHILFVDGQEDELVSTLISGGEVLSVEVDWSEFHNYRLEREKGGDIKLFIDDNLSHVFNVAEHDFGYLATLGSGAQFRFGSLREDRRTNSEWSAVKHCISSGFDVKMFPKRVTDAVDAKFDNVVNVIVEAG